MKDEIVTMHSSTWDTILGLLSKKNIKITELRQEIAALKSEPYPEEDVVTLRESAWRVIEQELLSADQIIAELETEIAALK